MIALFQHAPGLRLAGTFANLSRADDPSSPETARQVERLRAAASPPARCRASRRASSTPPTPPRILGAEPAWLDAVRPGLALYGVAPRGFAEAAALVPAMTLEARVTAVRRVPADTPLGYGGRFVTERPTTIAVLPIGYHDGFRRSFSGRVAVLLGGKRAPVVGAVSMDVTLVDASDAPVRRGDRAVCLGTDGRDTVTAWELADAAGTIPYEILCGIGPRVPRVHVESGEDPTESRG